ncbi:MAG: CaiB/BaiF CoA-transferase family protein [Hyphomicrobiaceae bacterium]
MTSPLPLAGVRVLDVASWIAAPAAAVVLGDWGADVIKVEPPGEGDPHRLNGTSLTSVPKSPVNYLWHLDARNKRSVALDLKHPDGRRALDRLIAWADVLITNFPHPVRARLSLDYETVSPINPRLIYASFTGYGETGPGKDLPGFDSTAYFGRSGISDLARYEGQPPGVPLPAQGDRASAMGLTAGILMALIRRQQTGKGGLVSSSLYANGLWANGIMAQAALLDTYLPPRPPRETPRTALANYYETRDGRWMLLAIINEDRSFPVLCEVIGEPGLVDDPRFATTEARRRNARDLTAILDAALRRRTWIDWHEIFAARNITHTLIGKASDIPSDPQAVAAKAVVATDIPEMPRTIASPFDLAGMEPRRAGPAPAVGEHTDAVLTEAGFSGAEIAALKASGAAT